MSGSNSPASRAVSLRKRSSIRVADAAASHTIPMHAVDANPLKAFHDVVYAAGVPDLADDLTMSAGVLWNKADAYRKPESYHQPHLRDVINVTRITGDMRILESLDRMFGRTAFDTKPMEACSDAALLELLCRVGKEKGELCVAVNAALKAKRFTPEHLQAIRAEAFDLVSEVMAFVVRAEGMVDA